MIYFVRRSFETDKNKIIHKKQLKSEINNILNDVFSSMNIVYSSDNLSYNSYGKPYLKNNSDVFFNISHCHEAAVCTVCSSETGIDIENIREYHPRVTKRVFSEKECEVLKNSVNRNETFFRIWTLKESFVKAIGIGISYPMKTCEFLVGDNGFTVNGCEGYSFSQIILNDEFVCSLCIKTTNELCKYNFFRVSKNEKSFSLEI